MRPSKTMIFRVSVVLILVLGLPFALSASDPRSEFDTQLQHVISKLNREAQVDVEGSALLAELTRREFGTPDEELKWAIDQSMTWGEIVALSYIRATTGRSFEAMKTNGAHKDFWAYVDKAGMRPERMAHSLESFLKLAEKERNSRIFERLRVSRRVQAMPDLGSGFGLFQEALDFRRIDSPRPTKIHTVPGVLVKGGQ
jgi:hypothetical protein